MRSKLNGIGADSCPNTVTVDEDEFADVPRDLYAIDVPGMACLLGIRFAGRSGTGPVAGKRDCLPLFLLCPQIKNHIAVRATACVKSCGKCGETVRNKNTTNCCYI